MTDRKGISLRFSIICMMSLLIFGPFIGVPRAQDLPPEILGYADMVLYNGQVLAMDRDQPPIAVTQAVAIRDGLVLAVGEDDRILQMAGPSTVRVNLDGKAVIPGQGLNGVGLAVNFESYCLSHKRLLLSDKIILWAGKRLSLIIRFFALTLKE